MTLPTRYRSMRLASEALPAILTVPAEASLLPLATTGPLRKILVTSSQRNTTTSAISAEKAEAVARDTKLAAAVAALEKAAERFGHCADMIASGFDCSGTLRAERTIKAKHYALETHQALAAIKDTDDATD